MLLARSKKASPIRRPRWSTCRCPMLMMKRMTRKQMMMTNLHLTSSYSMILSDSPPARLPCRSCSNRGSFVHRAPSQLWCPSWDRRRSVDTLCVWGKHWSRDDRHRRPRKPPSLSRLRQNLPMRIETRKTQRMILPKRKSPKMILPRRRMPMKIPPRRMNPTKNLCKIATN